ncbi:head GIN domain-containing protein [uncultured Parabacteroides sp.]|uniref:head GIN domain-containing protein n=1 Tax=uncultured Parabacteroides sp. TaxID=512312 RepID=UPI0026308C7D|nr:head GIN domain-containing protein [uncultured Parabacteroides sp.]
MRTKIIALLVLITFCIIPINAKKVKGNGDTITKEISVSEYSAIKIGSIAIGYSDSWFNLFNRGGNSSYDFGYAQGEPASLRITIDENLYPYLNIQVKNKELSISTEKGTQLSPTQLKIEGTSKKLEKIQMSGCMDFVLRSALHGDELEISATKGSDVKMDYPVNVSTCIIKATGGSDIIVNDLSTRIIQGRASGGSDLKLKGKAENGEYSASGGSDIKAYDLILNQLECSASGGSDIYTHVTGYIKASASGGSDVHYKGPAKSDTSTSGGSDIIKEGN